MGKLDDNFVAQAAIAFVTEIQGKHWQWNAPHCRRALADAKFYINNQDSGPVASTPEESAKRVIATLRAMKREGISHMNTIHCISWPTKDGRTWYEAVNDKPKPPMYRSLDVAWREV